MYYYACYRSFGNIFEQKIWGTHSCFFFSKIRPEVKATLNVNNKIECKHFSKLKPACRIEVSKKNHRNM